MSVQLLRTTTGFVPTKMEKMSPYFCERLMKERERFLTSRYGREPATAKHGGPGGKLEGLMDALILSAMMTTTMATTTVHIFFTH